MFRIQKKMGITTYEHKISSALYTTTLSITAKCSSFVKVPHVPPEHVLGGVGDLGALLAGVLPHPDVLAVDVVGDDVLLRRVAAAQRAHVVVVGLVSRHVVLALVRIRR